MPNPFAKTRPVTQPYAILKGRDGWEWRVLKTYRTPDNEGKNEYSRWMVAARSPHTYGEFEMGDTYTCEVLRYGRLVAAEPEWQAAYAIAHELPSPAEYLATA